MTTLTDSESRILRLYGVPTPDPTGAIGFLSTHRALPGVTFATEDRRDGEIVVTVGNAAADQSWGWIVDVFRKRHGYELFSTDGSTTDDMVARRLAGYTVVVVDSFTQGLIAARLIDAGVSCDCLDADRVLLGVPARVIVEHGVIPHVAYHMAKGQLALASPAPRAAVAIVGRVGVGTGADVPAGRICLSATGSGGATLTYRVDLQGDPAELRRRAATLAMHLLRVLHGPERLRVNRPVEI